MILLGLRFRKRRDSHLEKEVVVANEAKKDAITIGAVVSHHLLDGDFAGTSTLVRDILNEIRIASHNQIDSRLFFACGLFCHMAPTLGQVSLSGHSPQVSKPFLNAH